MYHHYSLTVFCICLYVSPYQQAFMLSYALLLLSSIVSFPLEGFPLAFHVESGLMLMNSLSFLPEEIFISPSFLKDSFARYSIFFFFQNFENIISLPLAIKVSAEKSAEKLMRSLSCGRSLFSCCFQSSLFVFDFQ